MFHVAGEGGVFHGRAISWEEFCTQSSSGHLIRGVCDADDGGRLDVGYAYS